MSALNSELRLEIEGLRDPRRIDVIARRQLGLTEPLPTQCRNTKVRGRGSGERTLRARKSSAIILGHPPPSRFQLIHSNFRPERLPT